MNKRLFLPMLFLLSGCVGDRLSYHLKGDAFIGRNQLCIKTVPEDQLEYYMLSSSENNYAKPLVVKDDVETKRLNTCIPFVLKEHESYELIYVLNGGKYRLEFKTDAHFNVIKTYSKS
ncbi:putative T6SS immunity periplasmic lipoprotein [Pantoea sp. NPDC088449]|uniref:putative T6SS immunity periplasmic lipoprotein n=1 Tax=unclassified Pantoea TaxID=2630326 RepID=UPI000EDD48C5|nr:hypothetical protein [Pantoea sp.]